jgi:hypothetical protein
MTQYFKVIEFNVPFVKSIPISSVRNLESLILEKLIKQQELLGLVQIL